MIATSNGSGSRLYRQRGPSSTASLTVPMVATGITPEGVIRNGDKAQEILKLIDEDEDITTLVLAAGTGREGPGPLVSSLGRTAGTFPIPVTIVPGHFGDEDLDGVS